MSLMRWRPPGLAPRRTWDFDRWFSDMFERLPMPWGWREAGEWPAVDVRETDGELLITAEVPGVNKDELDVTIQDNAVMIRGERRHEAEDSGEGYYRRELQYGRFARSIPLPAGVDVDKAEAKYRDGVLELRLPKLGGEKESGKKVKIE